MPAPTSRTLPVSLALVLAGVLAGTLAPTPAHAADDARTLWIGDPAPALTDVDWLQGQPVPAFGDGRVYLLDFWATWCGPCIQSIPHLNDLATELEEKVTVIGVAIAPRANMTPTDEFVAAKGADMAYTIAEDRDGATAAAYMDAAGQDGIPTCMIVDGAGLVSWIGSPFDGMEEALRAVVAGTFDREAYLARLSAEEALQQQSEPFLLAYSAAMDGGDWSAAATAAQALAGLDLSLAYFHVRAYQPLMLAGRPDEALAGLQHLLDGPAAEDAELLAFMAWSVVDPNRDLVRPRAELDLALLAATRADELSRHKNADFLDTLARVHQRRGNLDMAILIQERAVELGGPDGPAVFLRTLETYQAEAAAAEGGASDSD